MAFLNKVMLIGRLTDNPEEPRTLPNSGNRVIKFRFAAGRSRKNEQGQWENDPNQLYIDCEAFSRPDVKRDLVSLIAQYCKKGDQIFLEGRLQLDQWDDKNGGGKRSKHKVVVESIEFLGGGGAGGGGGEGGFSRGEGGYSGGGGGGFSGGGGGGYNRGGGGGGRPQNRAPQSSIPADDDMGGGYNDGGDNGDKIPF